MFANWYRRYLPQLLETDREEIQTQCPFHDDTHASFSVNRRLGLWVCYTGCGGGTAWQFLARLENLPTIEAKARLALELHDEQIRPIDPQELQASIQALWSPGGLEARIWLEDRGLQEATLRTYSLGVAGNRILIPIFDAAGRLVNIRRHAWTGRGREGLKTLPWDDTHGQPRLYPLETLSADTVFIVEGELDALRALQEGVAAVSVTGGAGTWQSAWNGAFKSKQVFICYDADEAGGNGAQRVAQSLARAQVNVRVLILPLEDKQDLTDWFQLGHTVQELQELAAHSPATVTDVAFAAENGETPTVPLAELYHAMHLDQITETHVVVTGRSSRSWALPHRLQLRCMGTPDRVYCTTCQVNANGGQSELTITNNRLLASLLGSTDHILNTTIRGLGGVPTACKSLQIDRVESYTVNSHSVVPPVDLTVVERPHTMRQILAIDSELISNQSYELVGTLTTRAKNQELVYIARRSTPHRDSLASFQMTPSMAERLAQVFQPATWTRSAINDKLADLYRDYANITGLVDRDNLFFLIDIVYHSLLSFRFGGRRLTRGWCEGLIIGDTRTGKTEASQKLLQHFQLGAWIGCENTSMAGLVGGLLQIGEEWFTNWGAIPQNSGRLLWMDEIGGLTVEEIAQLSMVRSQGVAEIHKIITERVPGRTRLIWMGNARHERSLDSFTFGIDAVRDLIGANEDIARFDLVTAVAKGQTSIEAINVLRPPVTPTYQSEDCCNLIRYAWTRAPEHVLWDPGVEQQILDMAIRYGHTYSSVIPLVMGEDHAIKLARMAVSMAARTFSTDDGHCLRVRSAHVEVVDQWLTALYADKAIGYAAYSNLRKQDEHLSRGSLDTITAWLQQRGSLARALVRCNVFDARDLEEQSGLDRAEVLTCIRFLTDYRLIEKRRTGYVKTAILCDVLTKPEVLGGFTPGSGQGTF